MSDNRVIVVGAGAGGMMAAGRAAELGARVLLLEKTERPGKKVLISGKSRCNLTNTRELEGFIQMYGASGRFLYSAFDHYFCDDLRAFLSRYGVETKAEPDGRVFPASDDAQDVVRALERYLADNGVETQTRAPVTDILIDEGRVIGVQNGSEICPASAVVLATGGASYPDTGSTGDGYRMAAALGHTITRLRPAVVPLAVLETERARAMQGASLKNVRLTAYQCAAENITSSMTLTRDSGRGINGRRLRSPVIESRAGDIMITHFGLSGPVTLQMSLAVVDALEHGPVSVAIDLRPEIDSVRLSEQLRRDFDRYGRRSYRRTLEGLLPPKLVEPFLDMTGIPPEKSGSQITSEEQGRLIRVLKSLRFNVKEPLAMAAAMVTAGGVSLKEIDPRTMASRLVSGLFFCGEVMDIDAETGGYNLQSAFSTGHLAGESAARFAAGAAR